MSECLITKLKGNCENDHLPRLGFIHLHVNNPSSLLQLRIASINSNFTAYIEGDGYFVNSNGENGVKKITSSTFNSNNYLTEGTYDVYLSKNFTQFNFENMPGGKLGGNIEEFSYCNLRYFQSGNSRLSGNLVNAIKGNSNVEVINVAFNDLYSGVLSELVSLCPKLTNLIVEGSNRNFTGSLVDLLDADNGYTLKCPNLSRLNVRFHSAIINENITVGGVETTALQRLRDLGVTVTI